MKILQFDLCKNPNYHKTTSKKSQKVCYNNTRDLYFCDSFSKTICFKSKQNFLNKLEINPYDMLKKRNSAQALEDYIRNGMFIHVPHKNNKDFGDIFWQEFINAKSSYISKLPPNEIYTHLRTIAEEISNANELNLAASKQVSERATALGLAIKNIFEKCNIKLNPDSGFLDIGCGNGEVAKEIAKNIGIQDSSIKGLEIIERDDFCNINRYRFDGQHIPKSLINSDFTTLINVLHHTKNEQEAKNLLKSIYQNMSNSGILLIREHNINSENDIKYWQVRHLLSTKVSQVDPPCLVQDTVYHSCEDWIKICSDIGFKLEDVKKDKSFGSIYSFYLLLKK